MGHSVEWSQKLDGDSNSSNSSELEYSNNILLIEKSSDKGGSANATTAKAPLLSLERRALIVTTVQSAAFITAGTLILTSVPDLIATEFFNGNRSDASYFIGVLTAVGSFIEFFSNPALGALSDSIGRRKVMIIVLLGVTFELVMLSIQFSFIVYVVARIIASMTAAAFAISFTVIADVSQGSDKGSEEAGNSKNPKLTKNFGLIGVAFGLGMIVGPLAGGSLSKVSSRTPFYGSAAISLVNLVMVYMCMPETLPRSKRKPKECSSANPFRSLSILVSNKSVAILACVQFLEGIATGVFSTFFLYSAERFGYGPMENGTFMGFVGMLSIVNQGIIVRVLISWLGEKKIVVFGLLSFSVMFFGIGLSSKGWMIYAVTFISSGAFMIGPALRGLTTQQVDAADQGRLQGALAGFLTIQKVFGPLIANTIFGYFISSRAPVYFPGAAFITSGCLALMAACLMILAIFFVLPKDGEKQTVDATVDPREVEVEMGVL